MPANPRGVIFYVHGGDEGASEVLKPENSALLFNQMGINENFGIVALDRDDMRANQSWDTLTGVNQNPDSQRMNRLRTWLVNNTGMNANTPIVTTGFSDGAGFSTTFLNQAANTFNWPVVAATPHNGAFGDTPQLDTMFTVAENDDGIGSQNLAAMEADMARAGTPRLTRTSPERVVTAAMFLREPSWDLTDANAVMADLQAFGLIDAQGRRLVPDNQIVSSLIDWEVNSTLTQATLGAARMRVLWATHRYSAYDAATECDFIRDRIP
jgi:dienelactone hydrolase